MSALPDPNVYFLEVPLYERFTLSKPELWRFLSIECFDGTLDAYCIECASESVFISDRENGPFEEGTYDDESPISLGKVEEDGYYYFPYSLRSNSEKPGDHLNSRHMFRNSFTCSRNENHKMHFLSVSTGRELIKAGQFPSIADLHQPRLDKYRKVLCKEDLAELKRGVGLSAHGVGIGACIYLRRVFEKLITEAHLEAKRFEPSFDEERFKKSRMTEKIILLKNYLPELLVENKNLYGIMSKAIHDLSENECRKMFPILLNGIELVLDEKNAKKEKEQKEAQTKKLI
ncbi:MAG: hypothetical protein RLP12_04230, partial [Ekhidna sp.]